jgi:acetylglutamate/LysW-gamma-L-alpha-aminoadipate kinase
MSAPPIIVKIGGGADINIAAIAADLASMPEPVILVHGANALRKSLAHALGRPVKLLTSASGQTSVHSDDDAIEVMMLAYSGLQNKRLVEQLQLRGRNAIGLSGLDGRVVTGRRNRGVRVQEGDRAFMVRDRSGKAASVNAPLLSMLLSSGYTPVITMPIADETGAAINSENDDVVAVMADAMSAETVVQLIEAPGLLRDPHNEHSLAPRVSLEGLQAWEALAEGRFRRKLRPLCRVVESNPARRVIVADGRIERPITRALAGEGTVIGAA